MSPRLHPTLAELRPRVQKQRHREIGSGLARYWARPSAVYGTWLALRLGLGAHQVTVLALLVALGSAAAVATGTPVGFLASAALALLAFWLDHVDGQVARWRGTASLDGVYLDYLMHHAHALALGFGLGFGLARRTGELGWTAAGFLAGAGWLFLGLHNDCRYKAFFQRLKLPGGRYRVDAGSAARPAPAARCPSTGRGRLTWPAFKLCEPHVVLVSLLLLATMLAAGVGPWERAWKVYLLGMALLAPVLATARLARCVGQGAVEAEFEQWFRSLPPT